ncbi:pirin family protein [Paraburkholderia sp. EG287B]|uniref:pirin family protein n=1 Tax=Paraburkholderia sp. EG287B TaxID=3237010 RepID=UPI0034D1845A
MLLIDRVETVGAKQARGRNHVARLVIDPYHVTANSPFLLMAEDWFAKPGGFPTHPHRGMETVTYVVAGELHHADHTGAHGVLKAGDVQFMTAGRGVLHSELPGEEGVHTLQLWLNLPSALKRVQPRYAYVRCSDAPTVEAPGVLARVYAGKLGDETVPFGSTWPITFIHLTLEAGASYDLPIPGGDRCFAWLMEGAAQLGAARQVVARGNVAWASQSQPTSQAESLPIVADTQTELLICSSAPIDEPVAIGGPFVMNSDSEIAEAFADLEAGRFV